MRYVALGCLRAVEKLLQAGADVNKFNSMGRSPLFLAAASGPNDKDTHSLLNFPLGFTIGVELLNILIKGGADVNLARPTGQTPLHWAAENGRFDVNTQSSE